jgi:hypothetical protein
MKSSFAEVVACEVSRGGGVGFGGAGVAGRAATIAAGFSTGGGLIGGACFSSVGTGGAFARLAVAEIVLGGGVVTAGAVADSFVK